MPLPVLCFIGRVHLKPILTMTAKIVEKATIEQYFVLPGDLNWQQFIAIQDLMAELPGLRIAYLDGYIEFITISEQHELIKCAIATLLEAYFFYLKIEYVPVGSATRASVAKSASFKPNESYYLGEKKEYLDLALEVVITSGSPKKLEKYKRFNISEVWFWENNRLFLYRLQGDNYESISRSELLPELDIDLVVRCVLIPSRLEAMTQFMAGVAK